MQVVNGSTGGDGAGPGYSAAPAIDSAGFVAGSMIAGRYRLDQIIGRGGMATVWRGHDQRLGRDVAIKLCTPMAGDRAQMVQETRLSSTLLHPNIVSIFDAGDISRPDGAPNATCSYIIMEYVNGTTAQQIAPVPWREAIGIVRQAAEGLAAAHERGIVHCDVKPGNLLIDTRGRVLVADFGIAMPVESESGDFVHGSPAYLAPERLAGEPADPRADVYGLGGVLAYLISGSRPSPEETSLRLDCPPEVASLIAKSRASDPRNRYPDARTFQQALDASTAASADSAGSVAITRHGVDRHVPGGSVESTRHIISPPRRRRPSTAAARDPDTRVLAEPARPVLHLTPATIGSRRRVPGRSTHRRVVTLALVGVFVLLAVFTGRIAFQEVVPSGPPPAAAAVEMPEVEGLSLATAIESLNDLGIVVDRVDVMYGPGQVNQVVMQEPAPGTNLSDHQQVSLVVRGGR